MVVAHYRTHDIVTAQLGPHSGALYWLQAEMHSLHSLTAANGMCASDALLLCSRWKSENRERTLGKMMELQFKFSMHLEEKS